MDLTKINFKNIKNTKKKLLLINIFKLYIRLLILIIILLFLLIQGNVIYLDSTDYDVVVKVVFKGITYNVKGNILNEIFNDKGGYLCYLLACHIVYAIALKENLWNQPFKSDFIISRKVLEYKSRISGSVNTELVNEDTVNLFLENFNITYHPEIKPGDNARRRFMRIFYQIIGKPDLREHYFVEKGTEPGSFVIKGLLQNTNSNAAMLTQPDTDNIWDKLQHRDCVVQFSDSTSTDLVSTLADTNINSPLEYCPNLFFMVIILLLLLLLLIFFLVLFSKKN